MNPPVARHGPSANIDPGKIRVLVVDSKPSSRRDVRTLLQECSYQVTQVKNSREALQLLSAPRDIEEHPFDLVLKEHEPPNADACRLLRTLSAAENLRSTPTVVYSSLDDRERVLECFQLGAVDYLVKPLRQNELRNLWTRVWQKRVTPVGGDLQWPTGSPRDSEETKCEEEEEEPTSKEGSAPGQEGNGSKEGPGNSGDKDGSGNRLQSTGVQSANKNTNGSASKNGNGGSNGNGASTTFRPEQTALQGTAEGGGTGSTPENEKHEAQNEAPSLARPKALRCSLFEQYGGRKRTMAEMAGDDGLDNGLKNPESSRPRPSMGPANLQVSKCMPGTTSNPTSDDTHHTSAGLSEFAVPRSVPTPFPPNPFGGTPFLMPSAARPQMPSPAMWAPNRTEPNVAMPQPDSQQLPPWSNPALMQFLAPLGPYNPGSAQFLMQLQMVADKAGIPPGVLLQQVISDTSRFYGMGLAGVPSPLSQVPMQMQSAQPNTVEPPAVSQPARNTVPARLQVPLPPPPPNPALMNPQPRAGVRGPGIGMQRGAMPGDGAAAAGLQNSLADSVQRNQVLMDVLRQHQQTAMFLQSMQMWNMLRPPGGIGGQVNVSQCPGPPWNPSMNALFPYGPIVPPVSMPDPSLTMPQVSVDSRGTLLGRKPCMSDSKKQRRQAAVERYKGKRKTLNFSNKIRYTTRQELAQTRPRSHGQFVSYKRAEDENPETKTNGHSKPVEDTTEEVADGQTVFNPCSGTDSGEEELMEESNGDEENEEGKEAVEEMDCADRDRPKVEERCEQDPNVPSSAPVQQISGPFCVLPNVVSHFYERAQSPPPAAGNQSDKDGNNGKNGSCSGSNCPDMQNQEK